MLFDMSKSMTDARVRVFQRLTAPGQPFEKFLAGQRSARDFSQAIAAVIRRCPEISPQALELLFVGNASACAQFVDRHLGDGQRPARGEAASIPDLSEILGE